jgi:hypothetical protein
MSDERLDRLIDEVVRQMTDGHPPSDFRARVIASLDRHPRRAWWTSWIAVPLGALAVTMIALAVARPFKGDRGAGPAPRQSGQAATTETAPAAPTPDGTTVRATADTSTVRLKADTTYEGSRGTRVAAAGRSQDPSSGAAAIAALAPPRLDLAPLGVDAIGVDALPTNSIAVTQLDTITPIAVEPLPTDDERSANGQRPSPNDRNE